MMNSLLTTLVAGFPALLLASCAVTQKHVSISPDAVTTRELVLTATVAAIDRDARILTLREESGALRTMQLDERAGNLDQLEVGDTVQAEYRETVELYLQQSREGMEEDESTSVSFAPPGGKPGITVTETSIVTAFVGLVNLRDRVVLLRDLQGNIYTMKIQNDARQLDEFEPGDQVITRHSKTITITVR
jgi:hypothetical protein